MGAIDGRMNIRSLEDGERSGRPRCTTDDMDQEIGLYSDAHVNALPRDIVRELELPVSARTVARRRIEIDLHTFVQRHEHAFTEHDLKRRIAFAEGYSNWTEDDWRRVLWSDHTLIHAGLSDSRVRHASSRQGMRCQVPWTGGAAAGRRLALGLLLCRRIRTCGAV